MFIFCLYKANIYNRHCTNIYINYISNFRFLDIVSITSVEKIFLKLWLFNSNSLNSIPVSQKIKSINLTYLQCKLNILEILALYLKCLQRNTTISDIIALHFKYFTHNINVVKISALLYKCF